MSIWSELNGSVTFRNESHISIKEVFNEVVQDHSGYECLFSFTEPNRKWNDLVTTYFRVAIDCDICELNDILREVDMTIRQKYPKHYMMDISIQTRFIV